MCHAYEGEKRYLFAQEHFKGETPMGCGQKAAADDAIELEDALKKIGLKGDKVWDAGNMPIWQEETIKSCADRNLNTEQTILALYKAKHEALANREAREEIEARKLLKQLKEKY